MPHVMPKATARIDTLMLFAISMLAKVGASRPPADRRLRFLLLRHALRRDRRDGSQTARAAPPPWPRHPARRQIRRRASPTSVIGAESSKRARTAGERPRKFDREPAPGAKAPRPAPASRGSPRKRVPYQRFEIPSQIRLRREGRDAAEIRRDLFIEEMKAPRLLDGKRSRRFTLDAIEHRFELAPRRPLRGDEARKVDDHISCLALTSACCATSCAASFCESSRERRTPRRRRTVSSSRRPCQR